MSVSLFLKDPASARYVAGGFAEVEELFGSPLPDLPAPEIDQGRDVHLVHVHSRLRLLQQRFLETQLGQIGALTLRTGDPARDYSEYEAALVTVVRSVRQADRRQGLLNLFWLAHSRDAAEHLRGLELRSQSLRKGKQSLFPLLQSFYRRVDQDCRRPRVGEEAIAWGENPSLVASDHRRRVRLHRDGGRRARPRPLPGHEQALPHLPRGILRAPADPRARDGAAAAGGRPGGCSRGWRGTCRCCPASTTSSPAAS